MDSTVTSQADRGDRASARKLRILVVDDNADSADMLGMSLTMMGHEVRVLYDPLLVVAAALQQVPDLAFLDVGMPVLNGFELATELRSQSWPQGHAPTLVALTGWGESEDRRRSEAAGFDKHLVKPADLDQIEAVCLSVSCALQVQAAAK